MIELENLPGLDQPILIAAFEGWNDAAEGATGVIDHLLSTYDGKSFAELDPEDYYDFQVNRPIITVGDRGVRTIRWPSTEAFALSIPDGPDMVLVRGIEPSMRWRTFISEIVGLSFELDVDRVVTLGSLLADTPHTRPVPVTSVMSDPTTANRMGLDLARYEGPTGIVGALTEGFTRSGIETLSFWAAVPHYVAQSPCPKATLTLLRCVEDALELAIPHGDLEEEARAWERGVDELARDDEEVAEYVKSLEEARDTADLPEASGDAIAKEFERYLRRRRDDGPVA
ncbi:MAG TPA: PAC2 family protein [Actinomycetes bacterium]|nr:PAC2 family protein [Actinomycetes bacterium]